MALQEVGWFLTEVLNACSSQLRVQSFPLQQVTSYVCEITFQRLTVSWIERNFVRKAAQGRALFAFHEQLRRDISIQISCMGGSISTAAATELLEEFILHRFFPTALGVLWQGEPNRMKNPRAVLLFAAEELKNECEMLRKAQIAEGTSTPSHADKLKAPAVDFHSKPEQSVSVDSSSFTLPSSGNEREEEQNFSVIALLKHNAVRAAELRQTAANRRAFLTVNHQRQLIKEAEEVQKTAMWNSNFRITAPHPLDAHLEGPATNRLDALRHLSNLERMWTREHTKI